MASGSETYGMEPATRSAKREDLARLIYELYEEAHRCESAQCWRGALVIIGGCLEAALLFAVISFESALIDMGLLRERDDPTRWTLARLVRVANRAGWLTPSIGGSQRFDVTMAIKVVDTIRNLAIHPGRLLRHVQPPDFKNAEEMRVAFEIVDRALLAVCDNIGLRVTGA
jgi:hypothetical protein